MSCADDVKRDKNVIVGWWKRMADPEVRSLILNPDVYDLPLTRQRQRKFAVRVWCELRNFVLPHDSLLFGHCLFPFLLRLLFIDDFPYCFFEAKVVVLHFGGDCDEGFHQSPADGRSGYELSGSVELFGALVLWNG